jgi:lipopolysaccharide transport system permease protein
MRPPSASFGPEPASIERSVPIASEIRPWVTAPETGLWATLGRVLATPRHLEASRDLILTALGRELRLRMGGAILGPVWPLVQPLFLLAVYGLLFTALLGSKVPGAPAGGVALGLFLFTGALVWSALAEAVTRGTTSLVDGRELVKKLSFPAEVLPLVPNLASLAQLTSAVLLFFLVGGVTGWAPWHVGMVHLPLVLFLHGTFALGLSWGLAAMHVNLRDVGQALPLALTALMFASPVFWIPSIEVLPSIGPWLPWLEASPFAHLLGAWRGVLLGGRPEDVLAPDAFAACRALSPWSLGALLIGRTMFARFEDRIADEV